MAAIYDIRNPNQVVCWRKRLDAEGLQEIEDKRGRPPQVKRDTQLVWIDPAQQAAITAFLAGTVELLVTMPPPKVDRPRKIKKKRDLREAWQIKNDEVREAYRTEITQRYAAGQKPTEIDLRQYAAFSNP